MLYRRGEFAKALDAAVALVFLAAFLAGAFLAAFLLGPASRRSASSSAARSEVISSSRSPRRSDAFVSPSVTYTPKRPSLATIGRPLTGSFPSSRNGGFGAPRPRYCRGWASSASASSSEMVRSRSSVSIDR